MLKHSSKHTDFNRLNARAAMPLAAAVVALVAALLLAGCSLLPQQGEAPENERAWEHAPIVQTAENDFAVTDANSAPYEKRYYYSKLSEEQQVQYRSLYAALMAHNDVASYAGDYVDSMQEVARALLLDCPEIFFAQTGGQYESNGERTNYRISYVCDAAQVYDWRRTIQTQVEEALDTAAVEAGFDPATINATTTLSGRIIGNPQPIDGYAARQLAWGLNQYLSNYIDYDWTAAEATDDEFYAHYFDSNTIHGALVNGVAMCGGYAQAYAYLCYQLGIPCVYVEGNVNAPDFQGAHAWNLVQIDGVWYNVDPTWSDDEQGIGLNDTYFLVPDSVHNEFVTELYSPVEIPAA